MSVASCHFRNNCAVRSMQKGWKVWWSPVLAIGQMVLSKWVRHKEKLGEFDD
ncbi:hypothetical protein [Microcoleus sp.]|uniref:hypothetical protein n=1 Tax=Microcoleus sp. TaxID=44472 RepID=UPI003524D41D